MTSEETSEQHRILLQEQLKCQQLIDNLNGSVTSVSTSGCPMVWDGIFCWPDADSGQLVVVPCPEYLHGFNPHSNASKLCSISGWWWRHLETGEAWTNYTQCPFPRWDEHVGLNNSAFAPHLPNIKQISRAGYTVSLATLVVAFCILASIRRLRCPRNNLHLHLFLSFVMRALMSILKDLLYEAGMDSDVPQPFFDGLQVVLNLNSSVGCRVFTSFWHYFLMANYSWILMEGLYLHNLIFRAMFTETSGIIRYFVAGWGLPIIFIIPWVLIRITLENTLCWTTNDTSGFFWIIRGPITLSIMVNFAFFLNIARVLFLKLFSAQAPQARQFRYRKWFRSTLVLVPLFGAHYTLLLAMSLAAGVHENVEIIWLYIDQFFSSFQGAVVAFLYCFLNGEVQSEIRKVLFPLISFRRLSKHRSMQENHSTSACTHSMSLISPTDDNAKSSNKIHANTSPDHPTPDTRDSKF